MKRILEKFSNYYIIFCIYALIGWLYEVLLMWFVFEPHKFVNRGVLFGPFLPIYGFGVLILILCLNKFMKKHHTLENPIYLITSVITLTSFIYITIIEYTTPKIYHVTYLFNNYGIKIILTNIIVIITVFLLTKINKKIKNVDVTIILVFLSIWIITTLLEYVSHFVIDKYFHKILWDYSKDFLNINTRVNWDASRNFAIGGTIALYLIQPLVNKILNKIKPTRKKIIALVILLLMILDYLFHTVLHFF
ncbi:MAG: putative ABC transporter permease [Bacilli bacterium]|nr:putative ABC transporter permease [Bacilli bacterium]